MNIVNILKSIQKLKSGLSAVIQNNDAIIDQAKYLYFKRCTITPNASQDNPPGSN